MKDSNLSLVEASPSGEVKTCSKCGVEKPLDQYYVRKLSHDGRCAACKECQNIKDRQREYSYIHKYGITLDDYNGMFEEQDGKCGICEKHQIELSTRLCVDHCHTTDEIRGLLCRDCNKALGMLGDNKESIQKVMDYL